MMSDSHFQTDSADLTGNIRGGVFVGRHREMTELKEALEEALSGRGRVVMMVGEPGIGKTRTARELVTCAEKVGAQVLWGWCYEGEGAPPYWPWVQPLRSYVLQKDPESLREEMGTGTATIAEIIPEVHTCLPDLKPPPALDSPEQARFRLFDAITTFLKNVAQAQPLVLVLDDLHWADQPSLLLLQFLARQLDRSRLLVVGCYRDVELSRQHPLAEALGQLTREQLFRRVLLRGLSQGEVGQFIEMASSITPPPSLVEVVHRQTEGNPLFVAEIVRLLTQEGELTPDKASQPESPGLRIPEGVREVIGRRLNRLSQVCNRVLAIASVIGQGFSLTQLSLLVNDLSEDQLLEALDEALAARLVEELTQTVGRYQFTHRLVQETLAEELSLNRRVRLHARVAEALEELYGPQVEAHAAELAYHFAQAETVTGPEKLAHYSLLAGEQALAAYAYEDALAHFQRGLAAKEGHPMDGETADLLFGLGRAQAATLERYQFREYLPILRRALDYYASVDDVDRAVAVAEYPMGILGAEGFGLVLGRSELISRILALVPPDSHEAGRLLSQYGIALYQETGDYHAAQDTFGQALVIARREQDLALEMRTLVNAARADFGHLRVQESLEKGRRSIDLARQLDDPRAEATACHITAQGLVRIGEGEEGQQHLAQMLAAAEKLRDRAILGQALYQNSILHKLEGKWHVARDFSDRALTLVPGDPRPLCSRGVLEYQVGNIRQGEAFHERLFEALNRHHVSGAEFA